MTKRAEAWYPKLKVIVSKPIRKTKLDMSAMKPCMIIKKMFSFSLSEKYFVYLGFSVKNVLLPGIAISKTCNVNGNIL